MSAVPYCTLCGHDEHPAGDCLECAFAFGNRKTPCNPFGARAGASGADPTGPRIRVCIGSYHFPGCSHAPRPSLDADQIQRIADVLDRHPWPYGAPYQHPDYPAELYDAGLRVESEAIATYRRDLVERVKDMVGPDGFRDTYTVNRAAVLRLIETSR